MRAIGGAVQEFGGFALAHPENADHVYIQQAHFFQVELLSIALDLRPQFLRMLRAYSPDQADCCAVPVGSLFNSQSYGLVWWSTTEVWAILGPLLLL
jgi:hypothetical protein